MVIVEESLLLVIIHIREGCMKLSMKVEPVHEVLVILPQASWLPAGQVTQVLCVHVSDIIYLYYIQTLTQCMCGRGEESTVQMLLHCRVNNLRSVTRRGADVEHFACAPGSIAFFYRWVSSTNACARSLGICCVCLRLWKSSLTLRAELS